MLKSPTVKFTKEAEKMEPCIVSESLILLQQAKHYALCVWSKVDGS